MPFHHRDPFDRLIVAQAQAEQIPIVSSDAQLDSDGIQRLGVLRVERQMADATAIANAIVKLGLTGLPDRNS